MSFYVEGNLLLLVWIIFGNSLMLLNPKPASFYESYPAVITKDRTYECLHLFIQDVVSQGIHLDLV